MKKLVLFLIVMSVSNIFPQVNVNSVYLKNPELSVGYVDSCASFWFKAWDQTRGGFYTNVSKTGTPLTSWGTQKDMISQSRNAYGLTRAYMLTGKKEYLELADKALKFMYKSAWDTVNAGWINSVNQYGVASNPTENKTAFNQHYALLGISAYYEATNDSLHELWLSSSATDNTVLLWDDNNNEEFGGYFDYGTYNWSYREGRPRRKVFLNDLNDKYTGFSSIIGKDIYTRNGSAEVENIFDARVFEFPKPKELIKEIILQGMENNEILLDFFSGSTVTAQAVLELNKQNSGKRKFICVQLPEKTEVNSEAYKAGYKTIADIGKERIRRVIKKIKDENESKLDLDGKANKQDLGFKALNCKRATLRFGKQK